MSPPDQIKAKVKRQKEKMMTRRGRHSRLFKAIAITPGLYRWVKIGVSGVDVLRASGLLQKESARLTLILQRLMQLLQTYPYYPLSSSFLGGQEIIPSVIKRIRTVHRNILIDIRNSIKNSEASIAAKRMLEKLRQILNIASRLPSVNNIKPFPPFGNLPYVLRAVKKILAQHSLIKAIAMALACLFLVNTTFQGTSYAYDGPEDTLHNLNLDSPFQGDEIKGANPDFTEEELHKARRIVEAARGERTIEAGSKLIISGATLTPQGKRPQVSIQRVELDKDDVVKLTAIAQADVTELRGMNLAVRKKLDEKRRQSAAELFKDLTGRSDVYAYVALILDHKDEVAFSMAEEPGGEAGAEPTGEAAAGQVGAEEKNISQRIIELLDELVADPAKPRVTASDIAQRLNLTTRQVDSAIYELGLREEGKYSKVLLYERAQQQRRRYSRRDILATSPDELPQLISSIKGAGILTEPEILALQLDAYLRNPKGDKSHPMKYKEIKLRLEKLTQGRNSEEINANKINPLRLSAWAKLDPFLERPSLEELEKVLGKSKSDMKGLTLREQEVVKWCMDSRIEWDNSIKASKLSEIKAQASEAEQIGPEDVQDVLISARDKLEPAMLVGPYVAFFGQEMNFAPARTESRAADEKLTDHERVAEAVFVDGKDTIREIAECTKLPYRKVEGLLSRSLHDFREYLKMRQLEKRRKADMLEHRRLIKEFVDSYDVEEEEELTLPLVATHVHGESYTRQQLTFSRTDVEYLENSREIEPGKVKIRERQDMDEDEKAGELGDIEDFVKGRKRKKIETTLNDIAIHLYGPKYTRKQWDMVRNRVNALIAADQLQAYDIKTKQQTMTERQGRLMAWVMEQGDGLPLTIGEISSHFHGDNYTKLQYQGVWRDVKALLLRGELTEDEHIRIDPREDNNHVLYRIDLLIDRASSLAASGRCVEALQNLEAATKMLNEWSRGREENEFSATLRQRLDSVRYQADYLGQLSSQSPGRAKVLSGIHPNPQVHMVLAGILMGRYQTDLDAIGQLVLIPEVGGLGRTEALLSEFNKAFPRGSGRELETYEKAQDDLDYDGPGKPGGSPHRALLTINKSENKELRQERFTMRQFQEKRKADEDPSSDTTCYAELNALVALQILKPAGQIGRAQAYQVTRAYESASTDAKRGINALLSRLPMRPAEDTLAAARAEIEDIYMVDNMHYRMVCGEPAIQVLQTASVLYSSSGPRFQVERWVTEEADFLGTTSPPRPWKTEGHPHFATTGDREKLPDESVLTSHFAECADKKEDIPVSAVEPLPEEAEGGALRFRPLGNITYFDRGNYADDSAYEQALRDQLLLTIPSGMLYAFNLSLQTCPWLPGMCVQVTHNLIGQLTKREDVEMVAEARTLQDTHSFDLVKFVGDPQFYIFDRVAGAHTGLPEELMLGWYAPLYVGTNADECPEFERYSEIYEAYMPQNFVLNSTAIYVRPQIDKSMYTKYDLDELQEILVDTLGRLLREYPDDPERTRTALQTWAGFRNDIESFEVAGGDYVFNLADNRVVRIEIPKTTGHGALGGVPSSPTNFGTELTYMDQKVFDDEHSFDERASEYLESNIENESTVHIVIQNGQVEFSENTPEDIRKGINRYLSTNEDDFKGGQPYHIYLLDTADKDETRYGTDRFAIVDKVVGGAHEKLHAFAGSGGIDEETKEPRARRSIYIPLDLFRALALEPSQEVLGYCLREEAGHATRKVEGDKTSEAWKPERAEILAQVQVLISRYQISQRLDKIEAITRRRFLGVSASTAVATALEGEAAAVPQRKVAAPVQYTEEDFLRMVKPLTERRARALLKRIGDAKSWVSRDVSFQPPPVDLGIWQRIGRALVEDYERGYILSQEYLNSYQEEQKIGSWHINLLRRYLGGGLSAGEEAQVDELLGSFERECAEAQAENAITQASKQPSESTQGKTEKEIYNQAYSQAAREFRAVPMRTKIEGIIKLLEQEMPILGELINNAARPCIEILQENIAIARLRLQEAMRQPPQEKGAVKIQGDEPRLEPLRIEPAQRKQWAESLVEELRRLPEGQRLGLVLDTSIGELEACGYELIRELEDLAERQGLKDRLDVITGHGPVLIGRVNEYLKEGKRKGENRIVRGVIHTRDQRNFDNAFSKKGKLQDKIRLVAVDDDQIQGLGRLDSERVYYIPLIPIIHRSITGADEPIPYTERRPGEEDSIVASIITLLPVEPMPLDELQEMFKEDANFVGSA